MDPSEGERKLVAILSADAAGYSRLMGADEAATVRTLTACRDLFKAAVASHHGRVVDTAGDSVLSVFDSVVEAVDCAAEVQRALGDHNADLPEDRRMRFRIGVNLGDVIARDDGTIYGDGVNIAARLESLAEPGGITVSGSVYDSVAGKLDLTFESLGEQTVKNIARPVRAYRVGGGVAVETAPVSDQPALPNRPSIAVLPFANMSGDPDQEFFADGIAEDLITALSGLHGLFVTARNSTFTYKGQAVDVKQVGADLGVRYVLEGSVRKGGNRVRVTAQLIDGATGNHVWAQRYDRDLDDIFAVQDEITEAIVASIVPELDTAERERARHKPTGNLDAWECYQRGLWHLFRFSKAETEAARALFERARDLDPGFSSALAALAWSHMIDSVLGFTEDHETSRRDAMAGARAALRCDENDPLAHAIICRLHFIGGDFEPAIAAGRAAIDKGPNFAIAHFYLGHALALADQHEEGLEEIRTAIRLSPRDPYLWGFETIMAMQLSSLELYDEAHEFARRAVTHPTAQGYAFATHASVLGYLGRIEEGRRAVAELIALQPDFSPDFVRRAYPGYSGVGFDHFFEGLRLVGFAFPDDPAGE